MSVAASQRRARAPPFVDPPGYARHRPESTLLYQLVEQDYPTFRELREEAGRSLPHFVQQEFDAYLKCGRMEAGFLRVRCELSLPHALRFLLATDPAALTLVLGEAYRAISRHLLHKAGLARSGGATGAVTLVQRFGLALNLNVHFHMLFLDGVYVVDGTGEPVFRQVAGPGLSELQALIEQIASRIGRVLERRGLVERAMENAWLAGTGEAGALDDLIGHSITYRIAVGPRAGQKRFTLQTLPARTAESLDDPEGAARAGGFSLHAGIDIAPRQRPKLERLCRYVSRPPVATERMALTASGHVRYALKTPYRDGTTHLVLEPLDFMARLAALVPPPRMHLTRDHGVFAPHSKLRAAITPAHRGTGASKRTALAAVSGKPPTRPDRCCAKPGADRSPGFLPRRLSPGPSLHRPGAGRATGHRGQGHHVRLRRHLR